MKSKVNYSPWVIMMCLLIVTNVSLWWGVLVVGGGYVCVWARGIWEIFEPSSYFCCEPETALKINNNKKTTRPRPSTRSIKLLSLESRNHTLIYF